VAYYELKAIDLPFIICHFSFATSDDFGVDVWAEGSDLMGFCVGSNGSFSFKVQHWNWFSLLRSEMFIDNGVNRIPRAPAERNVSHIGRETDLCFAPLERGESFGGRAFYKHLAPLGRSALPS
jgi:hypothetical protein